MKKASKILSMLAMAILTVVMCVAFAACGGAGTYTVEFDNIEDWDYCFANYNEYGDTFGDGMLNINSWGEKKLANNPDTGSCAGEGVKWTCTLVTDGAGTYEISLTAHLVGLGKDYTGEGDFTYMFRGEYTNVSGGIKCGATTYVEVSLKSDSDTPWTRKIPQTGTNGDFANYLPSAPWSINSEDDDRCDAAAETDYKIVPSMMLDIFKGATFKVSGDKITSVVDIVW